MTPRPPALPPRSCPGTRRTRSDTPWTMPARESARREETSSVIRPGHEDGSMKPREHLQRVLLILFARLNIRIWEKSRGHTGLPQENGQDDSGRYRLMGSSYWGWSKRARGPTPWSLK